MTRKIPLLDGCKVTKQEELKDEICIEGNDLANVSLSCAQVHQCVKVRHKDIRKFLDGIYVSDKNLAQANWEVPWSCWFVCFFLVVEVAKPFEIVCKHNKKEDFDLNFFINIVLGLIHLI